jgi:hypothetical protein
MNVFDFHSLYPKLVIVYEDGGSVFYQGGRVGDLPPAPLDLQMRGSKLYGFFPLGSRLTKIDCPPVVLEPRAVALVIMISLLGNLLPLLIGGSP